MSEVRRLDRPLLLKVGAGANAEMASPQKRVASMAARPRALRSRIYRDNAHARWYLLANSTRGRVGHIGGHSAGCAEMKNPLQAPEAFVEELFKDDKL